MPLWAEAGGWGLLAGSSLVLGAAAGWWVRVPAPVVAGVMAFGAGVLVSAMAFELVDEAERSGGLAPAVRGFRVGAVCYVAANALLARRGAAHRHRSGARQPALAAALGRGRAVAGAALL